jgi:hypothetical protein
MRAPHSGVHNSHTGTAERLTQVEGKLRAGDCWSDDFW